ncbi:hypothetical protein DFP72DRAFT_876790 [Ephemerocybe angulata]|uniref:Uncharacterized protein n=1 Tax=Ephemerocybe angulata TaxID=980116 RepID=A0A8H6MB70_9AGAR|nr:hypothetical protein DFP72DRAFT_876790 [Tulosesus angulatus]
MPQRSELDVAISEPHLRSQHAQQSYDLTKRRPSQVEGLKVLRTFYLREREAQDFERQRRSEWEKAIEDAASKRQQAADRKLEEMSREIDYLRAALHASQEMVAQVTGFTMPLPNLPPCPPPTAKMLPHYQSSSSTDVDEKMAFGPAHPGYFGSMARSSPATSDTQYTPATTPESQTASSASPETSPSPPALQMQLKKRRGRSSSSATPSSRDSDRSSDSSQSRVHRPPRKRANHHDKRCLTIQHAMRAHFWQMLQVNCDDRLPDSHCEAETLNPHEPIRFVWDKTTKQSVHNHRMKNRVLADIKENRNLYRNVPTKDFGKKTLDAAFEQCFTTFRQKYRAQNDDAVALQAKKREDAKARKARHVSRRKMKLSNRAESRLKLPEFQDVMFDPALSIECVSSEESDFEEQGGRSTNTLLTRGYAWRSSRLLRFYYMLDQEELSDKSTKPKRGVGKRNRICGPPKEGDLLPPKGVATWMISRRWLKVNRVVYPDLPQALDSIVVDTPQGDNNWFRVLRLGDETEVSDEDGLPSPVNEPDLENYTFPQMPSMAIHPEFRSTSSSLEFALLHGH